MTESPNVSTPMRTSAGIEATNSLAASLAASMASRMLPDVSIARMTSRLSAGTWASARGLNRTAPSPDSTSGMRK